MPAPAHAFSLEISHHASHTLVRFPPGARLFEQEAEVLGRRLLELAQVAEQGNMEVSLANVAYLTSTTLAYLLAVQKKLRARGGSLVVSCVSPRLYEVFSVARLDRVLSVCREGPETASV
jgi:anti-anti-sigma factor